MVGSRYTLRVLKFRLPKPTTARIFPIYTIPNSYISLHIAITIAALENTDKIVGLIEANQWWPLGFPPVLSRLVS